MGESERVILEPASTGGEAPSRSTPELLPLSLASPAASHLLLDFLPGAGLDPSDHQPRAFAISQSPKHFQTYEESGMGVPQKAMGTSKVCKEG